MKLPAVFCKKIYIVFILFFLSGCWDLTEVDELAYVTALGIEKDEENEGMVIITYVLSNPEAGNLAGGGGEGDEPPLETISFTANDFITARSLANMVVSKQLTYDLLRQIIVSEDFARDSEFIRWMYDITKSIEIKRDLKLFVSKESPFTFVENNQPKMDTRPHKYYELIFKRGQDVGTTPPSKVDSFFRITEADADLFLGSYGTTKENEDNKRLEDPDQIEAGDFHYKGHTNTTQFAGAAVFKEGIMIDSITIEETRLSYLLSNVMEQPGEILTTMPDPFDEAYQIAVMINRDGKVRLHMDLQRETPSIQGTVPIRISILTNHSMVDFENDKAKRDTLKTTIEDTLNGKFADFIKKTQEEYGAEPFGWSLTARKQFRNIPEYAAFDWMKTYPEMDINIKAEVELENFGRQTELPDLKEMRD
ncbi:Ger(x)C family spore germination C-terminal domain-containing protein [Virgibacillus kimchii]